MHQERFLQKQQSIFEHVYQRQRRQELIEQQSEQQQSSTRPVLQLQDDIYDQYSVEDDRLDVDIGSESMEEIMRRGYVPLRVVIIGRPNVGKSTLFNKLSGRYHAIVHSMPGVTRDIQVVTAKVNRHFLRGFPEPVVDPQVWNHVVKLVTESGIVSPHDLPGALLSPAKEFTILDTPGADNIDKILYQTELALKSAHLALFVTDRKDGLTEWDRQIGQFLLRYRKDPDDPKSSVPVVHLLNKFDDMFQLELDDSDKLREMLFDDGMSNDSGGYFGAHGADDDLDSEKNEAIVLEDPRYEVYSGEMNAMGNVPTLNEVLSDNELPGLGVPIPISSEHNFGINHIMDIIRPFHLRHWARANLRRAALTERLLMEYSEHMSGHDGDAIAVANKQAAMETEENDDDGKTIRIAIIGKPNVGKSTLINQLIGKDRLVTSPISGTTRDTIELKCTLNFEEGKDRTVLIADTAGMISKRRQHSMSKSDSHQTRVDQLTNEDTLRAIKYANVVCLVVDASFNEQQHTTGITNEELDIAAMVEREGRGLVLVANKWDLVKEPYMVAQDLEIKIMQSLSQISGLSVVVTSSTKRVNLELLMDKVVECFDRWRTRIPTSQLNKFIQQYIAVRQHQIPASFPRIHYVTQVSTRPPTFYMFYRGGEYDASTGTHVFPAAFQRQLTNAIRDEFNLGGVPIRIIARSGGEQKRRKQLEELRANQGKKGRSRRRIRKKMNVSKY